VTSPTYDNGDAVHPPAPAKTSAWEDIIDIFYAPTSVFERRRDGKYGVALVLQSILMAALFYAMVTVLEHVFDAMAEAGMRAAMAQNPQITPEMMERGRNFARYATLGGMIISWPILVYVVALVTWLVGKLFDSTATFGQSAAIATFSQFPRVLGQVFVVLQGLLLDMSNVTTMYGVSLSPARFLDPMTTNPYLLTLLMRFDPFVIWSTVLIAIGLSVIGKIPKDKAAMAAIIVWVLGIIPQLSQAKQMATIQATP
jgi:hypothetical protein